MARTLPTPDDAPDPLVQDMAGLGVLIRNRRAQSALRIDDAADQLDISKSTLSRLENGLPVNLEKLFQVLDGLGLKMLIVTKSEAQEAVRVLRPPREHV
jgi:transcriptional regulator with XRE-family HTH domain